MSDLVRRPRGPMEQARHALKRVRHDRGPLVEYLAFALGRDVYAAPVSFVREILKPPPLTPVPRGPFAVMGIVSVRGQLVTVIDLRRRLQLEEMPETRKTRILLVESPVGETLGLYVDEVIQVVRLADSEIEHAATALGGDVAGYIAGIARPSHLAPFTDKLGQLGRGDAGESSLLILLDLRAALSNS